VYSSALGSDERILKRRLKLWFSLAFRLDQRNHVGFQLRFFASVFLLPRALTLSTQTILVHNPHTLGLLLAIPSKGLFGQMQF
jgi:hypothetical protein